MCILKGRGDLSPEYCNKVPLNFNGQIFWENKFGLEFDLYTDPLLSEYWYRIRPVDDIDEQSSESEYHLEAFLYGESDPSYILTMDSSIANKFSIEEVFACAALLSAENIPPYILCDDYNYYNDMHASQEKIEEHLIRGKNIQRIFSKIKNWAKEAPSWVSKHTY